MGNKILGIVSFFVAALMLFMAGATDYETSVFIWVLTVIVTICGAYSFLMGVFRTDRKVWRTCYEHLAAVPGQIVAWERKRRRRLEAKTLTDKQRQLL